VCGVIGAQYGVGFAERLKAEQLRAGLALLVLAVGAHGHGAGGAPGRCVRHRDAAGGVSGSHGLA